MFWGAFLYDMKGPCHIWTGESAKEKNNKKFDLEGRNNLRESADKAAWEA